MVTIHFLAGGPVYISSRRGICLFPCSHGETEDSVCSCLVPGNGLSSHCKKLKHMHDLHGVIDLIFVTCRSLSNLGMKKLIYVTVGAF